MAIKKDEARFTIRFNQENPRHNKAMQILNQNGKGMASLIADALCMYIHYGADFTGDLINVKQNTNPPQIHKNTDFQNTLNSALDSFI